MKLTFFEVIENLIRELVVKFSLFQFDISWKFIKNNLLRIVVPFSLLLLLLMYSNGSCWLIDRILHHVLLLLSIQFVLKLLGKV
jgi:hypothetical protein